MNEIFCGVGSHETLYRATIMLDAEMYSTWWWGPGLPPANRVHVESALVHEFGHALMVDHWSGGGCSGGNNLVMCDFLPASKKRDEVWPGYIHDQENYTDIYGDSH